MVAGTNVNSITAAARIATNDDNRSAGAISCPLGETVMKPNDYREGARI